MVETQFDFLPSARLFIKLLALRLKNGRTGCRTFGFLLKIYLIERRSA